jgi:hypothetical protein
MSKPSLFHGHVRQLCAQFERFLEIEKHGKVVHVADQRCNRNRLGQHESTVLL